MTKPFRTLGIATVVIVFALSLPLAAQEKTAEPDAGVATEELLPEEEFDISGEEEYLRNCAVCHGYEARGDGPLAKNLKTPPADLTKISQRNNGGFPLRRIVDTITNGGNVEGHGSSDMPAWGEAFRDHVEPVFVGALILELALYLESIQEK